MKTNIKAIIVCGVILAMTLFLAACDDDSSKNAPDFSDISIPVTDETEKTSLDITTTNDEEAEAAEAEAADAEAAEDRTLDTEKEDKSTETPKTDTNTVQTTPTAGSITNPQTDTAEIPQVTQAPPTQQAEVPANTQATTASSGSSYEQIYNEYCQKLADYYNTAKGELQSEASSGKSIDELATSCSNKVSRLAEISTEGVNKMADLCVKRGGSASEYMNYGTKLESVYMDYGTKLEGVYMSGTMNSQTKAVEDAMKDLGLSGDISGQYSEEMNKAMDQYNDELNKAMDDYNQQMQDMLKEYGF